MSHLRRACALVAAATLSLTGVNLLGSPAQAASTDPRPVAIGAGWLADQLTNGLIHNDQYGFDDIGLSLDAGLSLQEVGGHGVTVAAIASAVGPKVTTGYAQGDEGGSTGYYAGATAKSLVFAQATGQDLATWAGTDLVAALQARVLASGPSTGRIADDSVYGDYANVIGQAFAARGLSTASSTSAGSVTTFLLEQQCADGYFRLEFTADKSATDQTCDGGVAGGNSAPDTDATAMAVLQLEAISSPSAPVTAAIAKAEAWLLGSQHGDGSFGGGASTEAANENSTGLAGWALGVLGDDAASAKAATWIRAHQADEPAACADALSTETGALGYDDNAVAAGRTDGITTLTQDQWRRATAQTLPALRWAPAAPAPLALTGPTGFVKSGSTVTYQVSGVAPGTRACVSGIGSPRGIVAPASGSFPVAITMPEGTGDHLVAVSLRSGSSASLQARVLGSRTLRVRTARYAVHRGGRVYVVVRGVRPGERVWLRFRGVTVRSGVAGPSGRFVRSIRVGHRLGKARVVAWGEFPAIRRGHTVVRVVR